MYYTKLTKMIALIAILLISANLFAQQRGTTSKPTQSSDSGSFVISGGLGMYNPDDPIDGGLAWQIGGSYLWGLPSNPNIIFEPGLRFISRSYSYKISGMGFIPDIEDSGTINCIEPFVKAKYKLTDVIKAYAGFGYAIVMGDEGDNSGGFLLGGDYAINPQFTAGPEIIIADKETTFLLIIGYRF
jgi:hypothetical protein